MSELENAVALTSDTRPPSYLLYGPPGSGKTTYFLYRPGKKFLIDVDNKAHEIENLPREVRESTTVWSCPDTLSGPLEVIGKATKIKNDPQGFRRTINVINELVDLARQCRRENKPFPYDAIGLDSWSAVGDHIEEKIKHDQERTKLSFNDWGLLRANNIAVLKGILQLPCERYIIAHDVHKTVRDKETQEVKEEYIRPAILGQLSETFGKYFTECWYFRGRHRSGDYQIQTVKDDLLMARTAKANMPPEVFIDQVTKQLKLDGKK